MVWVPFNESWGQFDTVKTANWVGEYDPYRLVNSASGGNFTDSGDILDIHIYPGPGSPKRTPGKVSVLGEFGGLGLGVKGHLWQDDGNWGYVSYADQDQLAKEYTTLIDALYWLKSEGLSAAIYTQTTDVEIEINGLMTYDRAVTKMKPEAVRAANMQLYAEPLKLKALLPSAAEQKGMWSFLDGQPDTGWELPGHNDSNWSTGLGGFGTAITPGAIVGTVWDNSDIWLRRKFEVAAVPKSAFLKIHHDEDAQVYLNGKPLWSFKGYRTGYILVKFDPKLIKKGQNVLAIHCHQTTGGQYIDAGIMVPE